LCYINNKSLFKSKDNNIVRKKKIHKRFVIFGKRLFIVFRRLLLERKEKVIVVRTPVLLHRKPILWMIKLWLHIFILNSSWILSKLFQIFCRKDFSKKFDSRLWMVLSFEKVFFQWTTKDFFPNNFVRKLQIWFFSFSWTNSNFLLRFHSFLRLIQKVLNHNHFHKRRVCKNTVGSLISDGWT
jgi:hypothetical protein